MGKIINGFIDYKSRNFRPWKGGVKFRKRTKLIKIFPKNEPIVAMINWNDKIYLATTKFVYIIENETVKPIKLKYEKSKRMVFEIDYLFNLKNKKEER